MQILRAIVHLWLRCTYRHKNKATYVQTFITLNQDRDNIYLTTEYNLVNMADIQQKSRFIFSFGAGNRLKIHDFYTNQRGDCFITSHEKKRFLTTMLAQSMNDRLNLKCLLKLPEKLPVTYICYTLDIVSIYRSPVPEVNLGCSALYVRKFRNSRWSFLVYLEYEIHLSFVSLYKIVCGNPN